MSFSLDTGAFKGWSNYTEAQRHWANQKPWRNDANNVRPLEKRSKKHCQIYRDGNNSFVLRLHGTDLIKFHENGTTEVYMNYQSISTENFVNASLRRTQWSFILNRGIPTVWKHRAQNDVMTWYRAGYQVDGKWALFDEEWQLVNTKPVTVLNLDVKKANAVRKTYRYADFTAWRKAYESVHPYVQESRWRPANWRFNNMTIEQVIAALQQGPEAWIELSQKCDDKYIMECIYRQHPEVVKKIEKTHFASINDWTNAYRLDQKYSWAV